MLKQVIVVVDRIHAHVQAGPTRPMSPTWRPTKSATSAPRAGGSTNAKIDARVVVATEVVVRQARAVGSYMPTGGTKDYAARALDTVMHGGILWSETLMWALTLVGLLGSPAGAAGKRWRHHGPLSSPAFRRSFAEERTGTAARSPRGRGDSVKSTRRARALADAATGKGNQPATSVRER